jgi:pSer/pThr/pTyr-binding forkhead associated (FHA) protein
MVLLAFLALIIWFMLKDLRLATKISPTSPNAIGTLVIVADQAADNREGASYPLLPITNLGRSRANDIIIDDDYSSNEHARISWQDSQWWLEDLGSSNGTFINDLPINKATVITNGDLITVGETRFQVNL